MISIKKINLNKNNFYYYFKIIFKFRNNKEYLKLNQIKKVVKVESISWLKKNMKNRFFFIIKLNNLNVGLFNFDKLNKTWSQVILKKYRRKNIGFISAVKLSKKLNKMGFKKLTTYASKKNVPSFKIHSKLSYKKKIFKQKKNFYMFSIATNKKFKSL